MAIRRGQDFLNLLSFLWERHPYGVSWHECLNCQVPNKCDHSHIYSMFLLVMASEASKASEASEAKHNHNLQWRGFSGLLSFLWEQRLGGSSGHECIMHLCTNKSGHSHIYGLTVIFLSFRAKYKASRHGTDWLSLLSFLWEEHHYDTSWYEDLKRNCRNKSGHSHIYGLTVIFLSFRAKYKASRHGTDWLSLLSFLWEEHHYDASWYEDIKRNCRNKSDHSHIYEYIWAFLDSPSFAIFCAFLNLPA